MGGLFSSPKAPKPIPVPDRGDIDAAKAEARVRRTTALANEDEGTEKATRLGQGRAKSGGRATKKKTLLGK